MKAIRAHSVRMFTAGLGIIALGLGGCGDDNSTNGTSRQGTMILMKHDAPVDDFTEAWVTVNSVTMIGDEDNSASNEIVLSEAVRMDLLSLDSIALLLSTANVESGAYSKIRLEISDPEFVRDDDSIFTADDIQFVANGHVDLNTQGDVFIVADDITVVSLDLDVENSIQINQTGNGRYILRPQVFVDNETSGEEGIIINGAVITSVSLNNAQLTVSGPQGQSTTDLTVLTTGQTEIRATGGIPLVLATLVVGSTVNIVGTIDMDTGEITATRIQVMI